MQNALTQPQAAFSGTSPADEVNYTKCLELGRNRPRVFKSKLPDTLRGLAKEARNVCGQRSVVSQNNHKFLFDAGLGGNVNLAQNRTSEIDNHIRILCRSCSKENDHIWNKSRRNALNYTIERSFIGALQLLPEDIDRNQSPQLQAFRTVSMRFGPHADCRTLLHVATDFARQSEYARRTASWTRIAPVIAQHDYQVVSPGVFDNNQID